MEHARPSPQTESEDIAKLRERVPQFSPKADEDRQAQQERLGALSNAILALGLNQRDGKVLQAAGFAGRKYLRVLSFRKLRLHEI